MLNYLPKPEEIAFFWNPELKTPVLDHFKGMKEDLFLTESNGTFQYCAPLSDIPKRSSTENLEIGKLCFAWNGDLLPYIGIYKGLAKDQLDNPFKCEIDGKIYLFQNVHNVKRDDIPEEMFKNYFPEVGTYVFASNHEKIPFLRQVTGFNVHRGTLNIETRENSYSRFVEFKGDLPRSPRDFNCLEVENTWCWCSQNESSAPVLRFVTKTEERRGKLYAATEQNNYELFERANCEIPFEIID